MFRADGVGKTVVVMELIEAILVDRPTYMGNADVRRLTCFPNVVDACPADRVELS